MTEPLPDDYQELAFEFNFPINPVDFIGDSFDIMRNNEPYGNLDIPKKTGDQKSIFSVIILLLISPLIGVIYNFSAHFVLLGLYGSALMITMVFVIFFNPFLRFLPVQVTAINGDRTFLFRSQFGFHKLSSLVRRNYWVFKDSSHHNTYSLYFSHNKGFLKINQSDIVLHMKKYNGSSLELINNESNVKFTTKLNKTTLSKSFGNFIISSPSQVDEEVVLFIGFVLYSTGQLNSLLEEIIYQSIRIEPERNKLMYGLISVALNSIVFPSLTVSLALALLLRLLHAISLWRAFFLIIDLILFTILWFFLIKNLLVAPIKHLKKNIWTEGDNVTYFISKLLAVMIIAMLLLLMIFIYI